MNSDGDPLLRGKNLAAEYSVKFARKADYRTAHMNCRPSTPIADLEVVLPVDVGLRRSNEVNALSKWTN